MFCLTTHSKRLIYGYLTSDIWQKDHSDSERGNPLLPHGLLFPISSKGYFTDRITHTTAYVTPVVEHWLEREIAQWVHSMNYLPRSYISLLKQNNPINQFSIKVSFSNIGQDKSKLQKQISKLFILTQTVA